MEKKWNIHEMRDRDAGVITAFVAGRACSKKAAAKFDRTLDHLVQMDKASWSRPHASPLGDHIYVIRFRDENSAQLRVFGHFEDAEHCFVMTLSGGEKMTSITLRTTLKRRATTATLSQPISMVTLRHTMVDVITNAVANNQRKVTTFEVKHLSCRPILDSKPKWADEDYRQAYMESAVHQTIAWQIRVNRERRGMTQGELAKKAHTHQSAISRAEDTEYEGHSLATLRKIANAFDCALLVNFVSYSELAYQSHRLSRNHLAVCGYAEEVGGAQVLQDHRNDTEIHSLR